VPRRIVLTGGPGAGKTAVLELFRQAGACAHVAQLPEAAGIVYGGGFPRNHDLAVRRAGQRAIFRVQRELEATTEGANPAIVLCDRGTVDGVAYWPGPGDLFAEVGTTLEEELRRYDVVIHLRTPAIDLGYNHRNQLRTETAAEAAAIDARIATVWAAHPRRHIIEATPDFLTKATRTLEILDQEMPRCCRNPLPGG
jgi:predicted ATPase